MLEQKLIAAASSTTPRIAEPIPSRNDIEPPREETKYPYFTSWIKQQVVDKLGGGQTGARQAFEGGLTIETTIDGRFQKAADDAIRAWLPYQGGPRASLVAIENKTGEVRAMVGGDDYNTTPFNLATQGQRQPGSAFKPFVLAEAMKKGISPTSVWSSRKKVFDVPGSSEKFTVENYSDAYAGMTTLANATTTSDNSVFAEVGIKTGTKRVAKLARRMGIRTPVSSNWAMTLGGLKQGVTPLDMAHAYETFARKGKLTYGSMSPGRLGPDRPVPGPVGIREISRKHDGKLQAITLPNGDKARNRVKTRRVLDEGIATTRRDDPPGRGQERHRAARPARPDGPGGRQDRHDRELRRRLVRGLDAGVHRRRLGRLPEEVPADEDRVPGRAGGRRHVPGGDLEDVHGVACSGSTRCRSRRRTTTSRGRRAGRDRRAGRHRVAGTGRARAVAARADRAGDGRRRAGAQAPAAAGGAGAASSPPTSRPPSSRPRRPRAAPARRRRRQAGPPRPRPAPG